MALFLAERVAQGQDAGGGNGEAQHGNHDTDSDKGRAQAIINLDRPAAIVATTP